MPFPQNNHSYYLPMKCWIKRLFVFERVYIDCCSAYHSDRVFWALCLISMPHSMILLLCLQSCYLLMQRKRKSELLMDIFCVSSFIFTPQIELSECCVWFQRFTQWCCSCVSNVVPYWFEEKWKEWVVDGCFLCVFFLLSSHNRLSAVSPLLDFNASPKDEAHILSILLAVDVKWKVNC